MGQIINVGGQLVELVLPRKPAVQELIAILSQAGTDTAIIDDGLTAEHQRSGIWRTAIANKAFTSGKFVFEVTIHNHTNATYSVLGIADVQNVDLNTDWVGYWASTGFGFKCNTGEFYANGTMSSLTGDAASVGYTYMIAVDLDSAQQTFSVYRNSTLVGSKNIDTQGRQMVPSVSDTGANNANPPYPRQTLNFGATPFINDIPSGHLSVNQATGVAI